MDAEATSRLDRALSLARPDQLRGLDAQAFSGALAELYAEADYVHPFCEGSSRTLRAFTAQLAEDAGQRLQWARMTTKPDGRDSLCLARDRAVNERSFAAMTPASAMYRGVQHALDVTEKIPALRDVVTSIVQPLEAHQMAPKRVLSAVPDASEASERAAEREPNARQARPYRRR